MTTPAARPRRMAPRYPARLSASVLTRDGLAAQYPVRDVSTGGLFLATEEPLEIFTELTVTVALQAGVSVSLPARVVHIMSKAKAGSLGIPAGMGLQFEAQSDAHREAVARLLDAARAQDPRPRIPRRSTKSMAQGAGGIPPQPSDPILAYLLGAIDGSAGPEELSERLSLDLELTERLLGQLRDEGFIELVSALELHGQRPGLEPTRKPRPEPPPSGQGNAAMPAASSPTGSTEAWGRIHAEASKRLARVREQNHYEVLGVPEQANPLTVRAAFLALSQRFQPDAHLGQVDPDGLRLLETLFGHLREAYGVIGRGSSRAEYDEYLRRQRALAAPQGDTASAQTGQPRVPQSPEARQRRGRAAADNLRRALMGGGGGQRPPETASLPERCLAEAKQALDEGRSRDALRSLQLLSAMDVSGPIKQQAQALRTQLMRSLAMEYEKKALYEERHQKWQAAAVSWQRVCEGRPSDPLPFARAARALLEAGQDLRRAAKLAQRAVALSPEDAHCHRVLGHVWLKAGMHENARTCLERAVALNQGDQKSAQLLRDLRRVV